MKGRTVFPDYLFSNYASAFESDLIKKKIFSQENIFAFEELLNAAQPTDERDSLLRACVRQMYFANPNGFMRFIMHSNSRLNALVMWTESKRIVHHFGIKGLVYVKWNGDKYLVEMHRNVTGGNQNKDSVDETAITDDLQNEDQETESFMNSFSEVAEGLFRSIQQLETSDGGSSCELVNDLPEVSKKNEDNIDT